jgi:nucleoside-diphosphate-sugar epimerase
METLGSETVMPIDPNRMTDERVLVTGAGGFIGKRVVGKLIEAGYRMVRCFVRPGSDVTALDKLAQENHGAAIEIFRGTLLNREDCAAAVEDVCTVIHLAMKSDKSFASSYMNTVVTTRNLLDALSPSRIKRFVNVSSFAVYSTKHLKKGDVLDEGCPVGEDILERHEAYAYAKWKQDQLVHSHCERYGISYVTLRPGAVYGPSQNKISGRVGIDTFGIFIQIGRENLIPLSYVDNCADAIVLAAATKDLGNEIINVVDGDLVKSKEFLKRYKRKHQGFKSLYCPYPVFYGFSYAWEKYAKWSHNQLPPVFNRNRCRTYHKSLRFSNEKLINLLGWQQRVPTDEGIESYLSG